MAREPLADGRAPAGPVPVGAPHARRRGVGPPWGATGLAVGAGGSRHQLAATPAAHVRRRWDDGAHALPRDAVAGGPAHGLPTWPGRHEPARVRDLPLRPVRWERRRGGAPAPGPLRGRARGRPEAARWPADQARSDGPVPTAARARAGRSGPNAQRPRGLVAPAKTGRRRGREGAGGAGRETREAQAEAENGGTGDPAVQDSVPRAPRRAAEPSIRQGRMPPRTGHARLRRSGHD
mmetsp:Transcript_81072/g.229638  ORF Transcript_81072/g.229638 Transcript_81072/m.229638 type:complete len:236 (+) Transcript_81072:451-1158(+)